MRGCILALAIVLVPVTSRADAKGGAIADKEKMAGAEVVQSAQPGLTRAVSLHVPALAVAGFAGQFEDYTFPRQRLSLSATAAFRSNAHRGDYSSYSYGLGAEIRYWFTGRAPWSGLVGRTMAGPYVGGRFDLMHTRVKDEVDNRTIGGALTFAESLAAGFRFLIKSRFEITPSMEVSLRTETDTSGRLGAWTRRTAGFGLSVGYMF